MNHIYGDKRLNLMNPCCQGFLPEPMIMRLELCFSWGCKCQCWRSFLGLGICFGLCYDCNIPKSLIPKFQRAILNMSLELYIYLGWQCWFWHRCLVLVLVMVLVLFLFYYTQKHIPSCTHLASK